MDACDLLFTGDLVLDVPDADYWLSGIAAATRAAAVSIGHLEVPHTRGPSVLHTDVPAPGADPRNLDALKAAGFSALTLAGNHIADCGAAGIADTIGRLEQLGIRHCGAGANLTLARAPAHIQIAERTLALLSYNCVGPEEAWASEDRAGCAYVRINERAGGRITPSAALTQPDARSLQAMQQDIRQARSDHDWVVVALHKGIVHTRARLAPYERQVAHAAIDAGATLVVGHHAHILRGIEFYRERPIFHGLGNGCVVTRALGPDQSDPARAAWVQRRRELFGFEPDPAYTLAPFHPEAIHALLARVRCSADGRVEAAFNPVFVEPPGRPVLAGNDFRQSVMDYVSRITQEAGLPSLSMSVREDRIVVS
ncbi:MAG TPA: CapA family protein [Steroidobacteraceae bacterium]|jgi:poly-gamma-glutamate capsule biosynthesis protein CapA/YwtB (metallophosphatase superfamily)|nr:CapA family protein [Steroidobacteraceae bacterium]